MTYAIKRVLAYTVYPTLVCAERTTLSLHTLGEDDGERCKDQVVGVCERLISAAGLAGS